ncbi:MAG TPA: ATP-binding protein [Candidatus Saccharimonadales bacterium]|nr:ATP-binding protein [Candidatus Saccharimonadales bacterium]
MSILLIALGIIVVLACVGGPIVYFQVRKIFREQKNFERGLKMVPLLIHLPPLSEDAETTGRDVRDVIEENISKAQIMYDIIASTLQKGFKSRFYGQRHIAFEIVGSKGFVSFYTAAPVALLDVVRQSIVSAYPTARLEEVAEHNIFSPVGKISGTMGGELTLKEPFAYPIATYQDLKRDAIQSMLNALSTLEKDDGAGIQIMLRPASSGWRKHAQAIASKKRKGKDSKKGAELVFSGVKQLFTATVKPPEDKNSDGGDKHELSSMDQNILDSIDEKTRHAGYEVLIRVVASSNISQRAQAILNNVVATFALFDSPGKNGFKYTPARDIERFVTAYILRFFPQESRSSILNTVELSTLFHFPDQKNIPTSQLERQASKQVDGPRNMPEDGLLLGYNIFRGAKKAIRLDLEDRRRHMYVVGQTGVGKSVFLENLALQDMLNGEGFAFIDPHGDTAERLLAMVPRERTEDVIYFCPAETDYPLGLNLFEATTSDQKDFLIQEAINMLYKLYDPQHQGIIGPRYEHLFRNAALTVMADPEGGTFIDIPKLFRDPEYVKQKLKYVTDPTVLEFWQKEMPQSQRSNEFGEVVSWFVSKFGAFLSNSMMRNIIGQTKSAFDLRDVMDNKKILLVNLSKGRTGELNAKLLGMIFVMKFQVAAMSRATVEEAKRTDFCLYVDEFQNFSTDSFATIMSEARKYHLNLIVANQFTTQLSEEIRDAVFGNMGTIISFRVGQNDVESLSRYFKPVFEPDDLLRVPNYNAIVRTLINGVPTQPFSMAALPALGTPNMNLSQALMQLSAAKFGRPRAIVDQEISERMKTQEVPRPAFSSPLANVPGQSPFAAPPSAPKPPNSGSSFLDEWLAKRKTTGSTAPVTTGATPGFPSSPAQASPTPAPSQSTPTASPSTPDIQAAPTAVPINKTDGVINLRTDGQDEAAATAEDTIYIDREGNLKQPSAKDQTASGSV